ncbi:MAG: hypothetical protein V3V52_15850 [Candidatus Adiutricales bacterium]
MKKNTKIGFFQLSGLILLITAAALFLALCGGGGGDAGDGDGQLDANRVITEDVTAVVGGVFSDNEAQPSFTIVIPAGAMITDAQLIVNRVLATPDVGPNQTAASDAFEYSLRTSSGGPVRLFQPLTITMAANPTPVHPQLGEIAQLSGSTWIRLNANFFRSSDNSVVTLTQSPLGTLRVVHRDLQRTTGPAVAAGFDVFMNETFGNENFFGDFMGLHTLLNQTSPAAALALGTQVDITRVPADIVTVMTGADLAAKDVALADPTITQRLIKADAVIGVKGFYTNPADPNDIVMIRAGITCALCHVTVAKTEFQLTAGPTLLPIGDPNLDGVPAVEMDAGAILALTPFAQADPPTATLLNSWGPGRFDIRALPDNVLDDGFNNPTAIPPLWNFVDLGEQGYAFGWDGLFMNDGVNNNALASQAEAVYDLVMHANGAFGTAGGNLPPELRIIPPQTLLDALDAAETAAPGNDIVTQDLLDIQTWMRSLNSPAPGIFDEALAETGFKLFFGRAGCVSCHFEPDIHGAGLFHITEAPLEGGLANGIRLPSLRGISRTAPYFHDHSAATTEEVIDRFVTIGQVPFLTAAERTAIAEYLKSI